MITIYYLVQGICIRRMRPFDPQFSFVWGRHVCSQTFRGISSSIINTSEHREKSRIGDVGRRHRREVLGQGALPDGGVDPKRRCGCRRCGCRRGSAGGRPSRQVVGQGSVELLPGEGTARGGGRGTAGHAPSLEREWSVHAMYRWGMYEWYILARE